MWLVLPLRDFCGNFAVLLQNTCFCFTRSVVQQIETSLECGKDLECSSPPLVCSFCPRCFCWSLTLLVLARSFPGAPYSWTWANDLSLFCFFRVSVQFWRTGACLWHLLTIHCRVSEFVCGRPLWHEHLGGDKVAADNGFQNGPWQGSCVNEVQILKCAISKWANCIGCLISKSRDISRFRMMVLIDI